MSSEVELLTYEEATKAVEAILNSVKEHGGNCVSIVVTDAFKEVVTSVRMTGASPSTMWHAYIKAYTASKLRSSTTEIRDQFKGYGVDISVYCDPLLTIIPGGELIPLKRGKGYGAHGCLGAVGVSGRPVGEKPGDDDLARIGAEAV